MGDAETSWSRRTWVLVLSALLVVLLTPSGVDAIRSARTRAHDRAARALRVTLIGASVRPQHGAPGQPVQDAQVRLTVRNDSGFGVRILAAGIDEPPGRQDVPVANRRDVTLRLRWRVRCAEVGVPPGPRQLLLRVRGHGVTRDVGVQLPAHEAVEHLIHLAAVDACAAS